MIGPSGRRSVGGGRPARDAGGGEVADETVAQEGVARL